MLPAADRLRLFALVLTAAGLQAAATYVNVSAEDLLGLPGRAAATLGLDQPAAPPAGDDAITSHDEILPADFACSLPVEPTVAPALPDADQISTRILRGFSGGAFQVTDCVDVRLHLEKPVGAARFAFERRG